MLDCLTCYTTLLPMYIASLCRTVKKTLRQSVKTVSKGRSKVTQGSKGQSVVFQGPLGWPEGQPEENPSEQPKENH